MKGEETSDDIDSILRDPRYKEFVRLCLDLRAAAQRMDAPKGLILFGVAWNFENAYMGKINKIFGVR